MVVEVVIRMAGHLRLLPQLIVLVVAEHRPLSVPLLLVPRPCRRLSAVAVVQAVEPTALLAAELHLAAKRAPRGQGA